ncbi:MAG: DEAD/DEAH box helicase [Bacteroidales bacterium]|nr:DEAD/DEAH box helicase [Bacteroidales bacterium]
MISFSESGLNAAIVEAVTEMGFTAPTPVQAECIPFLLNNQQDLIANAQTGTGKTAAFGLPILHNLDYKSNLTQVLILSPTRELAIQIANEMERFSKHLEKVNIAVVYGGASIEPQISALKRGAQIVVGTPGRTLDLIKRRKLSVDNIQWLVLDEADEMLNMGFRDELDGILETAPKSRQTLLFSATMPNEILQMSKSYMNEPHRIAVSKPNSGVATIDHFAYKVQAKDKYEALKRIADMHPSIYGIIFCRTRTETKDIADKLIKDGYNADALHGDLSQSQREFIMKRFRVKNLQLLVATDVAARGLDVDDLTHVINYSLPDDPEVYVHRSGRTGRAGKKGISVSIIHQRENSRIQSIQRMIGRKIEFKNIPNGREICEKQLFNLVANMEKVDLSNSEIDSFMDVIYAKLEWMTKEEVIKRFVSIEFNRFLDYYKNSKDLNVGFEPDRRKGERFGDDRRNEGRRGESDSKRGWERKPEGKFGETSSRRSTDKNFARLYVNLGSKNQINPSSLIGLINKATPKLTVPVGQIEILKKFSFFEIDKKYLNDVLGGMNGMNFRGFDILVEQAASIGATESPVQKSKAKPTSKERKRTQREK